jgi:hypothetical protein
MGPVVTSLVRDFEKKDRFVKSFIGDFSAENKKNCASRAPNDPDSAPEPARMPSRGAVNRQEMAFAVNVFTRGIAGVSFL